MNHSWGPQFRRHGISAHVTLWDDLREQHDRYILTERFGLFFTNGFDVSGDSSQEKHVEASLLNSARFEALSKRHSYHAYKNEARCRGHFTFGAS